MSKTRPHTTPSNMDWIPTLLKHLAISRSVVGASFATSAVLYFGPRFAPSYVDPVPKDWAFSVVAVLTFSAFLLALWGVSGGARWAVHRWRSTNALLQSYELSQLDAEFLAALGENPTESLNLDRVDYAAVNLTRLQVIQLVHGLEQKKLVVTNPHNATPLVRLTSLGRKRALEIQQAGAKNAA
jgi:hypothetical protein